VSVFLVDYPFADRLYPGCAGALARCARSEPPSPLRRRRVFQPRKVQRAGLWDAARGESPHYPTRQQMLEAIERPLSRRDHYVMVDDSAHPRRHEARVARAA